MEVSRKFSSELQESTAEFIVGVIDSSRELAATRCSLKSIHQGCEFDTITRFLETRTKTLQRLESLILANKSLGKSIASSSNPETQVQFSTSPENRDEAMLGYRGIEDTLETITGMLRKIELPAFTAKYPSIWINRAERFFGLGNYSDQDKLELISVSFEGAVLSWFITETVEDPFRDWDDFKSRLVAQYRTVKSYSPIAGNLTKESNSQMNVSLKIEVKIPEFCGNYPHTWLSRMERFCRINQYTEAEKLSLVPWSMKGEAIIWYREEIIRDAFPDWSEFTRRLVARFRMAKPCLPLDVPLKNESNSEKKLINHKAESFQKSELSQDQKAAVSNVNSLCVDEIESNMEIDCFAQPHVSISVSESKYRDTMLGDFATLSVIEVPKQAVSEELLQKVAIGTDREDIIEAELVQKKDSSISEETYEKIDDSEPYTMKTWCFDDMTPAEERTLIPSMSLNVNAEEEKVGLCQNWLCISKSDGVHELFYSMSKQSAETNTKNKQHKSFQARRFKFKNKSGIQKVKNSRSTVLKHHMLSSLKRWKYDCSVWHFWRNKTLQKIKFRKIHQHIKPLYKCGFRACVTSFQQEFQPLLKKRLVAVNVQLHHNIWPEQKGVLKLVDGLVVDCTSDANQDELMYVVAAARRVLCVPIRLQEHSKRKQRKYPKTWKFKHKQRLSLRVLPHDEQHGLMEKRRLCVK